VATFGLAVYGALPVIRQWIMQRKQWRAALQNERMVVPLLAVLLVAGVIALVVLSSSTNVALRTDQWVYGRYTDMYLLPLIGLGLLGMWRVRYGLWLAVGTVLAGGLLSAYTNEQNTIFGFNNKVNIQALWSMHVASTVHLDAFWVWGVLGAIGVGLVAFMGSKHRKVWLVLVLVPVALCTAGNYMYHQALMQGHASVSSLYTYIKTNYTTTDCIGFTPVPDSNERFNLYSYYLHGYDVKKMTFEQWQQQGCTGPYMTYDAPSPDQSSVQVVGREASTGLYMLTQTNINTLATRTPAGENLLFQ
jgi:hypothetical protein